MKMIANKLTPAQFGVLTDELLKGFHKFANFPKDGDFFQSKSIRFLLKFMRYCCFPRKR